MNIIAQYNSDWGSQTITSNCQINTDTLHLIEIERIDTEALNHSQCEREYVTITFDNGETIEIAAENGNLAPEGRKMLSDVLHKLQEPKFTKMPIFLVKVKGSLLDLLESEFDCFTRTQDSDEVILDASSLEEDEIRNLSFLVGFDTSPLSGCDITFQKG
jgi:hypothetical protein